MNLTKVTPVILTYNEKENIDRVLEKLSWAKEIIVIDSYSTDYTQDLSMKFSNVNFFQRKFDNHENQWNYGLSLVKSEWVLSLDADYIVSESLLNEISELKEDGQTQGYYIPFKYFVFAKPLQATILPPRLALFRKDKSTYVNDGHTQLLSIKGETKLLKNHLYHDDRKPLSRWLRSQDNYMPLEVNKLFSSTRLSFNDKVRKAIFFAPLLMFFYCLLIRGGIFDGKRGWFYAYQRMLAEALLSLRIIEYLMTRNEDTASHSRH